MPKKKKLLKRGVDFDAWGIKSNSGFWHYAVTKKHELISEAMNSLKCKYWEVDRELKRFNNTRIVRVKFVEVK